jgi:hypothetical protein
VRRSASVSGAGQVSVAADGAVQAGGGGTISGVYEENGKLTVRRATFTITASETPGDNFIVRAVVTASSYLSCPVKGQQLTIGLRHQAGAADAIAVDYGCGSRDALENDPGRSSGSVRVARADG